MRVIPLFFIFSFALSGCGTAVPEMRDFPNNQTEAQNNELVQAIIVSIHCELQDAITAVVEADEDSNRDHKREYTTFLDGWGAQVALTLQLEEKTTLNPNGVYLPVSPPTSIFTLAGGLTGTAAATRIDKVNYYFDVKEDLILKRGKRCSRDTDPPRDSLLIQSDLKLREWLGALINGAATGRIVKAGKENVLSHQITFQVNTGGSLTPAWKLVRATINQGGTFFSTSRDRKHDLVITLGPKSPSGKSLIPVAENSHLTSQLTSGIVSGVRALPPE